MPEKMLKFVDLGQQTPPKRGVKERKDDFKEIYKAVSYTHLTLPTNVQV